MNTIKQINIAKKIISVVMAVLMLFLIGTAGGLEQDTITLGEAAINIFVAGLMLLALTKAFTTLDDEEIRIRTQIEERMKRRKITQRHAFE